MYLSTCVLRTGQLCLVYFSVSLNIKSGLGLLHIRWWIEVNIFIIVNILLHGPPNKVEVKNIKLHCTADTFAFVTNPVAVLMVK